MTFLLILSLHLPMWRRGNTTRIHRAKLDNRSDITKTGDRMTEVQVARAGRLTFGRVGKCRAALEGVGMLGQAQRAVEARDSAARVNHTEDRERRAAMARWVSRPRICRRGALRSTCRRARPTHPEKVWRTSLPDDQTGGSLHFRCFLRYTWRI